LKAVVQVDVRVLINPLLRLSGLLAALYISAILLIIEYPIMVNPAPRRTTDHLYKTVSSRHPVLLH
jgi:hypothetical protein